MTEKFRIQTKRLALIPFDMHESDLFWELNTHPFIRKYLWDNEIIEQKTSNEIIIQNQKHFMHDGFGIWKIQRINSSSTIGFAGLWYFFDEPQPQLLYALLPNFTKKGYAREAGKAILNYAFDRIGYTYLIAATDELHKESQKVALSIGMNLFEKRNENGKSTLFYRIKKSLDYEG